MNLFNTRIYLLTLILGIAMGKNQNMVLNMFSLRAGLKSTQ